MLEVELERASMSELVGTKWCANLNMSLWGHGLSANPDQSHARLDCDRGSWNRGETMSELCVEDDGQLQAF